LVIIVAIPIFIPLLFPTYLSSQESWEDESEGIIEVKKGVAEITSVSIPKKVLRLIESITFTIKIKNTGDVAATFYVRCHLQSPGPNGKSYLVPDEELFINKGESLEKSSSWIVPEDASPGTYKLIATLYDAFPDSQANVLDYEIVMPALMVETDVSFLQVETFSLVGTEHKAIHFHIAERDVVRSGTWTFLFLTYAMQAARDALAPTPGGLGRISDLLRLPNWYLKFAWDLKKCFQLTETGAKTIDLVDGKSIDLLFWQIAGQAGELFEARMIDVIAGTGIPPKLPSNYITIIPKEAMQLPAPSLQVLDFDKSILGFYTEVDEYFPYWRFSKDEQYYPCSFYFDNDPNVTDNKEEYDHAVLDNSRPPYTVYVHIVFDADYITLQYWLYYANNQHWPDFLLDHRDDWDSRVYVIFERNNMKTPAKVGFLSHFWSGTLDWSDPALEKEGNHTVVYVAEGSHGSYSSPTGVSILSSSIGYFDTFKPGGITLGNENITNWVVIGKEIEETSLGNLGDYCLLEHESIKGEHPAPVLATIAGKEYWPKSFGTTESPLPWLHVQAPWHQDDTWPERVLLPLNMLNVIVYSPVDICVEDSSGRVVGTDERGKTRIEIPGALYTGPASEPETILIPRAIGEYEIYVHGASNGTFDLRVNRYSEGPVSTIINSTAANIDENETRKYDLLYPSHLSIILGKESCDVVLISNSTISGFGFNQSFNQVDFDVSGANGTMGFCNVTLPKNLTAILWGNNFKVTVDDQPLHSIARAENATHIFVHFTYTHSIHKVAILGFRPDVTPPTVSVLSPAERTYSTSNVPLIFTINESTSWIGYSLNGQISPEITGNTTLTDLSDGLHNIVVHACDNAGNVGSSNATSFTVDTTPPDIMNVSQTPIRSDVTPDDDVEIYATVVDSLTGVKHVFLNYTVNNGPWFKTEMTNLSENLYNTTIQRLPYGTNVTYVIIAEDNANNTITTHEIVEEHDYTVVPEFPFFTVLPLFMLAILLTCIIYKRRRGIVRARDSI
jgi:hypothetical protein